MAKALLTGRDFKRLVGAVTRTPSIGTFAGSELVHLEVQDGKCQASNFGVVLSTCQVQAKGRLPLIAVDERLLYSYSGLLSENSRVLLELTDKEIQIRSSERREVTVPFSVGTRRTIQPKGEAFLVSTADAKKLNYLAEISFDDASRPELNAVYLSKAGRALAVNQLCFASLKYAQKREAGVALPIPLCRLVADQYHVYPGTETVVQNGWSAYSMPSPVRAQNEFPVAAVERFAAAEKQPICNLPAEQLVGLIQDCDRCLTQLARAEIVLHLQVTSNKIELKSKNAGARYRATCPCQGQQDADIQLPLQEVNRALALLSEGEQVHISQGAGGEAYLTFAEGWLLFPSWTSGTKKGKKS